MTSKVKLALKFPGRMPTPVNGAYVGDHCRLRVMIPLMISSVFLLLHSIISCPFLTKDIRISVS